MRADGMDGRARGSKNAGHSQENGRTGEEQVKFSRDASDKANGQKNTANDGGVQHQAPSSGYEDFDKPITAKDIELLRSIGRKSINSFNSEDIQKAQKWAYKFYNELGTKSPFFRVWFGDWRTHQTSEKVQIAIIPAYIATNEARKTQRGNTVNTDTGWDIRISREGETNTISHAGAERMSEYGLSGIRQLVENAVLLDTEVHEHHSNNAKNDTVAFNHKLYALGESVNGSIGLYKITVEERYQNPYNTNERRFHNLKYIEKVAEVSADANVQQRHKGGSTMRSSTTTYSVSDLYEFVKRYDPQFMPKTASKHLLNPDATPKVVYHQTAKEFTVFENSAPVAGKNDSETPNGFFFKDNHKLYARRKDTDGNITVYRITPKSITKANHKQAKRSFTT